jgi:outer membrane biosynthesis protein TonB
MMDALEQQRPAPPAASLPAVSAPLQPLPLPADPAPAAPASKRAYKGWLLVGGGVLLLAGLGWGVYKMLNKSTPAKGKPPKITLLTPPAPPPPPPPPPKFEKKPEPPKEQKEIQVNQPQQPKVEQAPSPELKMDGPAGDGPSGFASGNITSDDISRLGQGGKAAPAQGLFSPYTGYGNQIKGELQRLLARNPALKRRRYVVEVLVWVQPNGTLKRYELSSGSGDADTDEAIQAALAALPGFSSGPPPNMPQPVRLRITTSG